MKCRHFYLEIQLQEIAHIGLHFNHSCIHLFTNPANQGVPLLFQISHILCAYEFSYIIYLGELTLTIVISYLRTILPCTNDLKLRNM